MKMRPVCFDAGVRPQRHAFNTVLSAAAQHGDLQLCRNVYQRMIDTEARGPRLAVCRCRERGVCQTVCQTVCHDETVRLFVKLKTGRLSGIGRQKQTAACCMHANKSVSSFGQVCCHWNFYFHHRECHFEQPEAPKFASMQDCTIPPNDWKFQGSVSLAGYLSDECRMSLSPDLLYMLMYPILSQEIR
jgi:pentatricopeptide repeat protein